MLMRGRRLPGWSEGVGTTMAEEQTSMEEPKVTTAWAEMLGGDPVPVPLSLGEPGS